VGFCITINHEESEGEVEVRVEISKKGSKHLMMCNVTGIEKTHLSFISICVRRCGGYGHFKGDCSSPNGSRDNSSLQLCFKCRGRGHVARECPNLKKDQCFTCGQKGHHGKNCPQTTGGYVMSVPIMTPQGIIPGVATTATNGRSQLPGQIPQVNKYLNIEKRNRKID
jgi:hypothetical protein